MPVLFQLLFPPHGEPRTVSTDPLKNMVAIPIVKGFTTRVYQPDEKDFAPEYPDVNGENDQSAQSCYINVWPGDFSIELEFAANPRVKCAMVAQILFDGVVVAARNFYEKDLKFGQMKRVACGNVDGYRTKFRFEQIDDTDPDPQTPGPRLLTGEIQIRLYEADELEPKKRDRRHASGEPDSRAHDVDVPRCKAKGLLLRATCSRPVVTQPLERRRKLAIRGPKGKRKGGGGAGADAEGENNGDPVGLVRFKYRMLAALESEGIVPNPLRKADKRTRRKRAKETEARDEERARKRARMAAGEADVDDLLADGESDSDGVLFSFEKLKKGTTVEFVDLTGDDDGGDDGHTKTDHDKNEHINDAGHDKEDDCDDDEKYSLFMPEHE